MPEKDCQKKDTHLGKKYYVKAAEKDDFLKMSEQMYLSAYGEC